jgi:hypothetical protein
VRKLPVIALMVALIYVTTWVLAAHATPRASKASSTSVVRLG